MTWASTSCSLNSFGLNSMVWAWTQTRPHKMTVMFVTMQHDFRERIHRRQYCLPCYCSNSSYCHSPATTRINTEKQSLHEVSDSSVHTQLSFVSEAMTQKWLTVAFAQGKNIPRQKRPSSGPPTIPKMLKAAWRTQRRMGPHVSEMNNDLLEMMMMIMILAWILQNKLQYMWG